MALVASASSLLLPGTGQALRGRPIEAALFLWAALWLHTLAMAAVRARAAEAGLADAFFLGAFGPAGALKVPEAVVLTVVALATHLVAAWAALRGPGRRVV